ncbi:hypothetical protein OIO90_004460 [Microbotryomycetes sp. JL221]|nr:hypothetical protein OIO90_004460 [Microbotryomycetes sp. JL221]
MLGGAPRGGDRGRARGRGRGGRGRGRGGATPGAAPPSQPTPTQATSINGTANNAPVADEFVSLKYVLYTWRQNNLLKKDPAAQKWYKQHMNSRNVFPLLGPTPVTIRVATLSSKTSATADECFLSSEQCHKLIASLATLMGLTRAQASWKKEANVHVSKLYQSRQVLVNSVDAFLSEIDKLQRISDRQSTQPLAGNLMTMKELWRGLKAAGKGAILAVDVEMWEHNQDKITELGWSAVDYSGHNESRTDVHAIVEENAKCRNGKYVADARDLFVFGRSETLPIDQVSDFLELTIGRLSTNQPLLLLLHDVRSDLKALELLGVKTRSFKMYDYVQTPLSGVHVVDTQTLFQGYTQRKRKVGLGDACKQMGITTTGLHNAGNDAHFTLDLFESMMVNDVPTESAVDLLAAEMDQCLTLNGEHHAVRDGRSKSRPIPPEDLLW